MNVYVIWLGYLEVVLCLVALCTLVVRRRWKDYWAVGTFLAVRAVSGIAMGLLLFRLSHGIDRHAAYREYFYIYWIAFAVEAVLAIMVVYSILRITVAPLRGLRRLTLSAFGGMTALAVLISLGSAFTPYATEVRWLVSSISQLQRAESFLTLCVMVFVAFAVRPMGLSYRSPVFGVSVGLALAAASDFLMGSFTSSNQSRYMLFSIGNSVVMCGTLLLWSIYFGMRETGRREIALGQDSVFARLDRVGMAWEAGRG